MKQLTILSGGGSPHSALYKPVYELIQDEARSRGVTSTLIDYVGFGHYPDYGLGLSLPSAAEKALDEVSRLTFTGEGALLCRSFGCDVGVWLMGHHPKEMKRYRRIILWGPSAFHTYWGMVAIDNGALERLNYGANRKGVALSPRFWETYSPIEESLQLLKGVRVSVGYGTEDKYCGRPFASYVEGLLCQKGLCHVDVTAIEGAGHEIRPSTPDAIKTPYFRFIFDLSSQKASNVQPR